jgi:putative transposase
VKRHSTADAPHRLWVADVTDARKLRGFENVVCVTDVFSRRVVGWNIAATLEADSPLLKALDMTAFDAGGNFTGLTKQSDHGSNRMAMV